MDKRVSSTLSYQQHPRLRDNLFGFLHAITKIQKLPCEICREHGGTHHWCLVCLHPHIPWNNNGAKYAAGS